MDTGTTDLPASDEAEEAAWEIATAERLQSQGDLAGAASWYRRAAEHFMDAGDDDRALDVAKKAAELAALHAAPPVLPVSLAVPAPSEVHPAALTPTAEPVVPVVPRVSTAPDVPDVPDVPVEPFAHAMSAVPTPPVETPVTVSPGAVVDVPAVSEAPVTPSRRPRSIVPERVSEAEAIAAQLPALPLFSELPSESIRGLALQATLLCFEPGQVIVRGTDGEGPLLVLTEGEAEARATPEQPGVPLGAGDFAGELAAYYGGRRVIDVVAMTRVEAVAFAPTLVRATARDFESFRDTLEDAIWAWAFTALPWVSPLLRRLDPDTRAAVFNRFERVRLREGDVLQGEGVRPGSVWLVAAGEVEVYGGELGAACTLRARAGDALGVGAVLADEPSGVSARAVRGVLAARMTAEAFRGVVSEEPTLGVAVGDIGAPGSGMVC